MVQTTEKVRAICLTAFTFLPRTPRYCRRLPPRRRRRRRCRRPPSFGASIVLRLNLPPSALVPRSSSFGSSGLGSLVRWFLCALVPWAPWFLGSLGSSLLHLSSVFGLWSLVIGRSGVESSVPRALGRRLGTSVPALIENVPSLSPRSWPQCLLLALRR